MSPKLFLVLLVAVILAFVSQLVGYVTPGWLIYKNVKLSKATLTYHDGVWYGVVCTEGQDCKARPYKEYMYTDASKLLFI